MKEYDKVIAVNILNQEEFVKDVGNPSKPRIFTVERVVGDQIRLFQVGTYSTPLKFSLRTGIPILHDHSRSSTAYKIWKNYRIELYG